MSDNEFAQSLSDIMTSQILSIKILRGTTHFMQSRPILCSSCKGSDKDRSNKGL